MQANLQRRVHIDGADMGAIVLVIDQVSTSHLSVRGCATSEKDRMLQQSILPAMQRKVFRPSLRHCCWHPMPKLPVQLACVHASSDFKPSSGAWTQQRA